MVHRLLKEHWARGARTLKDEEREAVEERLDAISARSSERERAAMLAERDVDAYYAALYLSDKVGEEYDGVVTAVLEFGFFVELTEEFVEGLVKTQTLGVGAAFDPERQRLLVTGGFAVGMGALVRVRVENVSVARRQIDFALLTLDGRPAPVTAPAGPRAAAQAPEQKRKRGGAQKKRGKRKR
jgi:ribonuclease R